jgi:subtilase family serine protease
MPIQLPADIAASVIDVSGLESYTRPKPLVSLLTPFLTSHVYDTANMLAAGLQGQGRTIGISNWSGFRALNYVAYVNHFSLPVPAGGAGANISVVPCGGGGAGAGPDSSEGELDIQMELGMAPLANIIVYDGTATGNLIATLAQEVNDDQADVISESYGWNIPANNATSAHNLHLSMSAQGITYVAASGDNGTAVDPFAYPDYDPEVLAVGGTVASVNASTGARISEVGWSGSGGSWSTNSIAFNVRPSWQTGTGVLPVTAGSNHRLVPDVAFHAAGTTTGAYPFYKNNAVLTTSANGTSFASPIFAGMLAIVEQDVISRGGLLPDAQGHRRFGRMQDLIYSQNGQATIWFDVVSGSNGHRPDGSNSTCTVGWDSVTGWGAMDCEAFVNAVAPPACTAPSVYCSSQVNSLQCVPAVAFSGQPSLSNSTPFLVTASNVLNNKSGLLFYGYQSQNLPFQGGTMCVHIPTLRTPVQNSGGSATGNDCTGTFSFNFTTWINAGADPLLQVVGQQFNCQYWSRDPQSQFKTNLTDAVEAHICP